MKDDYPYDEAIKDLVNFFKTRIKNKSELDNLLAYLNLCAQNKNVPIRSIHQKFMDYCDKYHDYQEPLPGSKKMWDDLFYFWQ